MSAITDIWRQLVRRRLWPVALLLLGALVAVPVLLRSDPAVAPAAPVAPVVATGDALDKPVVALASNDPATVGRRHVLGVRKDPFAPAPVPTVTHKAQSSASTATAASTTAAAGPSTSASSSAGFSSPSSTSSTSSGSGTAAPAPSTPSTPAPATPAKPKAKTYPLYSLSVRFGDAASSALTGMRLLRLQPLPDADSPVAIYLGPGPDKRSAVFLVDESATPDGDGTCKPNRSECEKVVLRAGDTEFFDVKDPETGQVSHTYELDLVSIVHPKATAARKAKDARAARGHASRAGVARTAGQVARVVGLLDPAL
jgi:hypothetical protein